jgi:hypothetical protein
LRGIGSIAMTGSAARDRIFGALILALGETIGGDIAGAIVPWNAWTRAGPTGWKFA